jgi:long-chain acyl-CoA synthetase
MRQGYASFSDRFDKLAPGRADRLAIREDGLDWRYADVYARSVTVSDALRDLGIRAGHAVALMAPNSGAFVSAFVGIARAGGVISPFNVRYQQQELVYYLRDTRASAIIAASELVPVVAEVLATLEDPPSLVEVVADGSCSVVGPPTGRVDAIAAWGSADTNAREGAPLLLQYTSGSTGAPKRVIRTNRMLLDELERLSTAFRLSHHDRFLGAAPFSHVNGLVRTMMTSMFVGGALYPVPVFARRPVLDLMTRERITYFGAVPYMFAILARSPARGQVDLSGLRVAFSASAPLLPADNRLFAEKYGSYVRQLYGSTETGTISVNLHDPASERLESVGLPLSGVRIEIWDEDGRPVPPGEEGEVVIASPHAITAYDGNPEATAASFRDGFYLSGDLGVKDAEGYLTLTGRKKFLINRGGFKVNPNEVEKAILAHPQVAEVVVLAAPSSFGDDLVRCVIVRNGPCTEGEIVEHCRTQIADYKVPSLIEFRDELPKSPTGKILRGEL